MAARVGLAYGDYDPLKGLVLEEAYEVGKTNVYPKASTVDSAMWWRVRDYILAAAPTSIEVDSHRFDGLKNSERFTASQFRFVDDRSSFVTGASFGATQDQFVVSIVDGRLYAVPGGNSLTLRGNSAVVGFSVSETDTLLTQIGSMRPTQIGNGSIVRVGPQGKTETLATELHRPVHTVRTDLNGDGTDELVVCEFGYYEGQTSVFAKKDGRYHGTAVLELPGTIKTEIVDLNADGHLDIIVLASQGQEGIYALYGDGQLNFRREVLVQHPPHWGTSWFVLADIDGDTDLDLAIANGDNADYSIFAKPYHGVRIYENDGSGNFSPHFFYPMYGATRLVASDFNADGLIDFAVSAFFPNYSAGESAGFVLLEQQQNSPQFVARLLPETSAGRWLIMEGGDLGSDGDVDLLLGSFPMPPGPSGSAAYAEWQAEPVDVMVLENIGPQSPKR